MRRFLVTVLVDRQESIAIWFYWLEPHLNTSDQNNTIFISIASMPFSANYDPHSGAEVTVHVAHTGLMC